MRDKIKELLKDREWSLYRLSKESKVAASTLHDFLITEKIKTLNVDKVEKIAQAFGIPINYFLDKSKNLTILKSEQYKSIHDEDIRMIARASEYMTKEEREELRRIAERLYNHAFRKL